MGNYLIVGLGNYVIAPLGNYLTLRRLRLRNYVIADRCRALSPSAALVYGTTVELLRSCSAA